MDKTNLAGQTLAEMPRFPRSPPTASRTSDARNVSARGRSARVIEVLAYPSVQLLDVTGPLQVFASANDHVAQTGGTPPYVLRVVAKGGQGVTGSSGLGITTSPLPRAGTTLDTLMIAGGPGVDAAIADPALVDWVWQRTKKARRVASPRSAPAHSCWPLQARWTDGGRLPIGHAALNLPGAFPPCRSSPTRSSFATVRSGPRPG